MLLLLLLSFLTLILEPTALRLWRSWLGSILAGFLWCLLQKLLTGNGQMLLLTTTVTAAWVRGKEELQMHAFLTDRQIGGRKLLLVAIACILAAENDQMKRKTCILCPFHFLLLLHYRPLRGGK